ncbi:hypothetical protein SAMN04487948_103252 [Halogranum amylolyticum]|uniref:Uncharacterized protein n=1 Tax=Halogranum amylolyticum TaxID=660520 RepID=A0A1H8QQE5_9EURY|nr:hypothetical protein [Halogranum amylolyticum]SEO56432.1 hypothetical protein SAMN04487948_103252 [Halogranum amylolyticum]
MDERFERFVRTTFRSAGRRYAEARSAYHEGRDETGDESDRFDLPRDDEGNARLVCRRYAERRAVAVDAEGRPACFDPDHPDCRGCAEDVREGVVETW